MESALGNGRLRLECYISELPNGIRPPTDDPIMAELEQIFNLNRFQEPIIIEETGKQ